MSADRVERFRETAFGYVDVVALWYPAPHNCWRIEVQGAQDGALENMTMDEAKALHRSLMGALGCAQLTVTWSGYPLSNDEGPPRLPQPER